MPMKISVACCTYNGARFIEAQLRSVFRQTRLPDEIVLVDDGSTDETMRIVEDLAREAPPGLSFRIERNPSNQGVVANFEKALSLTTGDLLFLCDQDDVWYATKIEVVSEAFEQRSDLALLHSDGRLIGADGTPLAHSLFDALELTGRERRQVREGAAFAALLVRNLATGAATALRRSVFEIARPFPREWIHDEWLTIVAAATGRVDFLDVPLIDYRQHAGNQIGMRKLSWRDKFELLGVARGDRFAKIVQRTDVLRTRLDGLGSRVPASYRSMIGEKRRHALVRATLPRSRLSRIAPIAREVITGRYTLFSSGVQGIVRDCLEPM